MVQRIRNGGSLPSCTSKVLTICGIPLERQYASKVSCSQLLGTPLLSELTDRVSESRTCIRIALFRDVALANMAANRKPACRATIRRILIKPTPPLTTGASVACCGHPGGLGFGPPG